MTATAPFAIPEVEPAFQYWDGKNVVHADPLAIMRQILIRTGGKPNDLPNKVYAVRPDTTDLNALQESWDAAEQLVTLVRDLFRMQPFEPATGTGARDAHCWAVWDAFADFMSDQKKTPALSPISSPSMAVPPASSSPTSSTSASS